MSPSFTPFFGSQIGTCTREGWVLPPSKEKPDEIRFVAGATKKIAVHLDDRLDELQKSQESLSGIFKNGCIKSPLVLVPEDVKLVEHKFNKSDSFLGHKLSKEFYVGDDDNKTWASSAHGQYIKKERLGELLNDCYEHLHCLKNSSGHPYLDGKKKLDQLKRLYLCGHSGGGGPLAQAAGSDFVLPTENSYFASDKGGVDLWLFDCTYSWFDNKNYINFCRAWYEKGRLGHAPNSSRLICVWLEGTKTGKGADDLMKKIEREILDGKKLTVYPQRKALDIMKVVRGNRPLEFSMIKEIPEDLLEALRRDGVVFIRTSVPHGRIPTVFIPLLLWSAAS